MKVSWIWIGVTFLVAILLTIKAAPEELQTLIWLAVCCQVLNQLL